MAPPCVAQMGNPKGRNKQNGQNPQPRTPHLIENARRCGISWLGVHWQLWDEDGAEGGALDLQSPDASRRAHPGNAKVGAAGRRSLEGGRQTRAAGLPQIRFFSPSARTLHVASPRCLPVPELKFLKFLKFWGKISGSPL